ncbi:MAG: phage holin family protein [Opitutales bacterium]
MNSSFLQLLLRWLVLAVGVTLATKLIPGIQFDDGATLVVVVLMLSFFNAILKPLLVLFTLPFILLTMGLGMVVINALLFILVGQLVRGFHVAGFWPAVGAALIVSVTNFLASRLFRRPPPGARPPPAAGGPVSRPTDVIDI